MTQPYIVKMRPYLRPKVWGGRKLADQFKKRLPGRRDYGEAWEVSDLAEGQSTVTNGPLAGDALPELVNRWGEALAGEQLTGPAAAAFPLLVKILDAQDDLSVQVHPGQADIERLGLQADSKDEAWIILQAEADGCILHGFDQATEPDAFRQAVLKNRAADMLRRVSVTAGDVVRVPPGTIHAICKGVALLEIQQPSDTTYRVYDYNRPGLDGAPRPLHLDQAMKVANFDAHSPAKLHPSKSGSNSRVDVLVDAAAYRIERAAGVDTLRWQVDRRGPHVVFVADGRAELTGPRAAVELGFAQTAVIPAGLGEVRLQAENVADVIVAGVGGAALL